MPETATTTPQVRHAVPADITAETDEPGDVRESADEKTLQAPSPREFYTGLTKRADVRAFLRRLAERCPEI